MTFEEYAVELLKVDPEGSSGAIDWTTVDRLWLELVNKAELLISSIAPGAHCTAQEWDRRIDCTIKLSETSVIGERVHLTKMTEQRLTETAKRLQQRAQGDSIPLVDELRPPLLIGRGRPA